jgi:CO/xanthine dehydrogenase Mo-binding subunit
MVDGVQRVSGTVPYALNVEMPGLLVGKILRSPHAHARLARVDVTRAQRLPGVLAVVSREDVQNRDCFDPFFGPLVRDQPVVALDRVRYVGEAVAAVAAVDRHTAEQALELIEVEYEELPAVFEPEDALAPGAPLVHGRSNMLDRLEVERGDLQQGFREADFIFEDEYRCPGVQHVPLEPHVAVAHMEGGRLTVVSSTQTPHVVRAQLAAIFKLPLSHVRVVVHTLGGAYGAKCYPKIEPITALLAWKAHRPVKLVLTRAEDFLATCRAGAVVRLKTGVLRDGTLVARHAVCYFNKGAYTETGPRVVRMGGLATCGAYRIPHVRIESSAVFTNLPPSGPFRAPGAAQTVWATESHLDAIARRLGMSPLELRRKNLAQSGDRYVGGGELEDLHFGELLDHAVQSMGWAEPDATRQDAGNGHATAPSVRHGRAIAMCMKTTATPSTSTAACTLNQDGSLSVLTSSVEMGQGAKTALAQIAADAVGVPLEAVSVSEPDTDTTPYDQTTSSSRTTNVMGIAIRRAGEEVRKQLTELAAAEFEVSAGDVLLADGRAAVRGAPHRSTSYAHLVRESGSANLLGRGTFTNRAKPDPVTGEPGVSDHWHHAVGAAEVAVDVETGKVRLLRCHAGVFVGRMINPTQCELQAQGSATFGVGQALMEELVFDAGQLTNPSLADYMLPSFKDVPPVLTVEALEDPASVEVHGIGETAQPAVLAAIANAVADAIGTSISELPITPERVMTALSRTGT